MLPNIAVKTGGDQIAECVRSTLFLGNNVVDIESNIVLLHASATVLTCEIIPGQHFEPHCFRKSAFASRQTQNKHRALNFLQLLEEVPSSLDLSLQLFGLFPSHVIGNELAVLVSVNEVVVDMPFDLATTDAPLGW